MTKITPQQEKFAQCVAKGMTQANAYREAYNTTTNRGNTVHCEASKLANSPNISQRIDEIRRETSQHLRYDAEAHFKKLEMLHQLALTPRGRDGSISLNEAIKAVVEQGKLCGLYIDKKEITGGGGGPLSVIIKVGSDDRATDTPT